MSGDRFLFRQWHRKFTTAFGQLGGSHEELEHRLVKEIDLGKEMQKVVAGPRADYGDVFARVSGNGWNMLMGKAEIEACDKIDIVPK